MYACKQCNNTAPTEVRSMIMSNNVRHWCYQCQLCGRRVGGFLSKGHPDVLALADMIDFDKDFRAQQFRAHQQFLEEQSKQWWAWYSEYLKSSAWQSKRQQIFRRSGGRCEDCGAPAVQVHHLSYEHVGNELLDELMAVCLDCHEQYHGARHAN